jgi:hypothetical protein
MWPRLVAIAGVGQAEIVDLPPLHEREPFQGQLGAELVEVAHLVVVAPDPTPARALLPLLGCNLRRRALRAGAPRYLRSPERARRDRGRQPQRRRFRQESSVRQVTLTEVVDQMPDTVVKLGTVQNKPLSPNSLA